MFEGQTPGAGESQPAGPAFQELQAKLALQRPDLLGHGRL
jgi:hypothetical protein